MRRIIYVEDDIDTAETVKTILEMEGFSVEIAKNGEDGLKKIRKNHYDIALLDIMLPGMSGYELYKKVKNRKIKFAFLSALHISRNETAHLIKWGLSDYITKPFSKKDLIERVSKLA